MPGEVWRHQREASGGGGRAHGAGLSAGHHHTFTDVCGRDYQILLEADYIANASENGYERRNVENFINRIMWTESGKALAKAVFCV